MGVLEEARGEGRNVERKGHVTRREKRRREKRKDKRQDTIKVLPE